MPEQQQATAIGRITHLHRLDTQDGRCMTCGCRTDQYPCPTMQALFSLVPVCVEVLVVRDPDGPTAVTVFVDGKVADAPIFDVDPGRGWTAAQWDDLAVGVESTVSDGGMVGSVEFRSACLKALNAWTGTRWTTEGTP